MKVMCEHSGVNFESKSEGTKLNELEMLVKHQGEYIARMRSTLDRILLELRDVRDRLEQLEVAGEETVTSSAVDKLSIGGAKLTNEAREVNEGCECGAWQWVARTAYSMTE